MYLNYCRSQHFVCRDPSDANSFLVSQVGPFTGIAAGDKSVQIQTPATLHSEDEHESQDDPPHPPRDDASDSPLVEEEAYYAVDFISRFYIGRTLKRSQQAGFWEMKFLHQSSVGGRTVFKWPATDDLDKVHESTIFYGPVGLTGVCQFTVAQLQEIETAFASRM